MLYIFTPKCKWQKENQTQLTQANSNLSFVVNFDENHNAAGTPKLQCTAMYVNTCNETEEKSQQTFTAKANK